MDIKMIFLYYLILINIIGFIAFAMDKQKAIRHKWRIRESVLFLLALLGGGLGCILGMQIFRHKTKHASFTVGIPSILLLEIVGIFLLFTLTGCQTEKEQPPAVVAVESELDLLKNADKDTVKKYISNQDIFPDTASREPLDPEVSGIFTQFFKDFDYTIISSDIQENTATVNLELITIDAKTLAKDFVSQSIIKQIQGSAAPSAVTYSLKDYYLSLYSLLKEKKYNTVTSKCTIALSKKDETWVIDEGQHLDNLLTGSFSTYVANPDLIKPEEVVAIHFDTIKSFDTEQMNQFLSLNDMFSADDEYKRTISKALSAQILTYLDYKITDSADDGMTAKVTMDVTSCDCLSIIQKYTDEVGAYTSTSQALADGISGRLTKANQILVDCINNNTASSTTSITLALINDGASWKMQMDDTVSQAILGNIEEAIASVSTTPPSPEEE